MRIAIATAVALFLLLVPAGCDVDSSEPDAADETDTGEEQAPEWCAVDHIGEGIPACYAVAEGCDALAETSPYPVESLTCPIPNQLAGTEDRPWMMGCVKPGSSPSDPQMCILVACTDAEIEDGSCCGQWGRVRSCAYDPADFVD